MAATPVEHLHAMVRRVREVRPDIEISLFTLFSVGDDPSTRRLAELMDRGGGLFGRFFGEPERVASGLAWLESIGIDRASLSPMTEQALDLLAPHVL